MGYESRIYVVRKSNFSWDENSNKKYAEKMAMLDMCKCYSLSDKLRKCPKTDCYIYADDGNTQIMEDCYGEELTECSIEKAIEYVEKAMAHADYWRYNVLHAMLTEFKKWETPAIVVLHFGY